MADTKRQLIVTEIVNRMKTIRLDDPEGRFQTDLGANVEDWRTRWEQEELPALAVCDLVGATVEDADPNASNSIEVLPINLRIFIKEGTLPTELRKMIGDVQTAIKADPRWLVGGKGLAIRTNPVQAGMLVPETSEEVAGAMVAIEVVYKTGKFNAYE